MLLTIYAIGRSMGGALGVTTATKRHQSSTILRKLGGQSLMAAGRPIPAYFDPRFGCEMEVLRFDSRQPAPSYNSVIEAYQGRLAEIPVLQAAFLPVENTEPAQAIGQIALRRPLSIASSY